MDFRKITMPQRTGAPVNPCVHHYREPPMPAYFYQQPEWLKPKSKWSAFFVAGISASALALTACADTKRVVEHLPTPPERLVCERAGTRPTIPPEAVVAWERIISVSQAKAAHDAYVASVRAREAIVAGHVLNVEGKLERCAINADWRKEYEAGLSR